MLLFYITHPDKLTAQKVVDHLLERKLIACANIFPMQSAYWWQGALTKEDEWVSLLKTRTELENRVEQAVQEMHPYEVPCIMRFEVRANEAYEGWIAAETATPTV